MCEYDGDHEPSAIHAAASITPGSSTFFPKKTGNMPSPRTPPVREVSAERVMQVARLLASWSRTQIHGSPRQGSPNTGFVCYGDMEKGERALILTSRLQDPAISQAISKALEERGVSVDLLVTSKGPLDPYVEREFDCVDEVRGIIRRGALRDNIRKYDGIVWVEEAAEEGGYNAFIHGDPMTGGPVPPADRTKAPYRYYCMPWMTRESFGSPATDYPVDLHKLIDQKTWQLIHKEGRGARIRLTDPEGTDIQFTLWDDYYSQNRSIWQSWPIWGHLFGHPGAPFISEENTTGKLAGTTSHMNRPFPRIELTLEDGRVTSASGGGEYGKEVKRLIEETSGIQYPQFPGRGLLWFGECAIGTNPKVHRPRNVLMLSSGGTEVERSRSGVIHVGLGTMWRDPNEVWAMGNGAPYGHLHVHLLFPTYEVTKDGRTWTVIDNGHLTSLDDPEVRSLAKKYGDPDDVLSEAWVPSVPGINAEGSYDDYAADPSRWFRQS